jgi:hypothetical protein
MRTEKCGRGSLSRLRNLLLGAVAAIAVSGCGSGSPSSSSPPSSSPPTITGATPCTHGITSNNCDFAQAVYAAFSTIWASSGSAPHSLTVRTNPVACSAYAGDAWFCRSRVSPVALEFQMQKPSQSTSASTTTRTRSTTTGSQYAPAAPGSPPVAQVQKAVVAILDTCIKHNFDNTVDLGPASQATDTLIRFSHTYNLDAQMGRSDLKAHTLRQALAAARDTLRPCSPQDASRLDAVLSAP